MTDPFLLRALAAGVGIALICAPLGCFVVWQRMAYFGETVAQASLIGIALGLALELELTASALVVAAAVALTLVLLSRQRMLPLDSILGLLAHAALAAGVVLTALAGGPSVDLLSFLFGDIFAVTNGDLWWIAIGGVASLTALAFLWRPLLAIAVHEEMAAAEGMNRDLVNGAFVVMLAVAVAIAMKIVGVLLVIAFLIMPAAAARPVSATPEGMAAAAVLIAVAGVIAGLGASLTWDVPGGPAIVLALAALAMASMLFVVIRSRTA